MFESLALGFLPRTLPLVECRGEAFAGGAGGKATDFSVDLTYTPGESMRKSRLSFFLTRNEATNIIN